MFTYIEFDGHDAYDDDNGNCHNDDDDAVQGQMMGGPGMQGMVRPGQ